MLYEENDMQTTLRRLGKMGWLIVLVSIVMASSCQTKTHRQSEGIQLEPVAFSDAQWTGIAISQEGRLFVNYPRWSANVPLSVAELKNGDPIPYPNDLMNNWKPGKDPASHFVCIQAVFVDDKDRLWKALFYNFPHS